MNLWHTVNRISFSYEACTMLHNAPVIFIFHQHSLFARQVRLMCFSNASEDDPPRMSVIQITILGIMSINYF